MALTLDRSTSIPLSLTRKFSNFPTITPKVYFVSSKCMVPKPKAYSSKKYKKFHGIVSQKLSCINQKV